MAEMLQQGDRFPTLTFNLLDGSAMTVPDDLPSRYAAIIFYRGHW